MKKPDIVFIAGNSRSGTTMMGRMLSLHDDIFTFNELHFFEQLWSASDKDKRMLSMDAVVLYATLLKNQRAGYISNQKITDFIDEAKSMFPDDDSTQYQSHSIFELFLKTEAKLNSKSIPCEQTPRNVLYLQEILDLYPNAKIITMVRDPRDVLLSQKSKWKRKSMGEKIFPMRESIRAWLNYHPITISKIWETNFSMIQKFSMHPSILLVKFEDLLENPKEKLQEVCEFLNITYTSKMLLVPHIGSSHSQDVQKVGVSKDVAGNWNKGGLTKSEIQFCQQICRQGMIIFDYKMARVQTDFLRMTVDIITFPFKLILALAFNLNRMKSIGESITRRLRH